MTNLLTFVGAWTPLITATFVLAEFATLVLSFVWRRRGVAALRQHDYDLGQQYLDEAPKLATMATFIAILPIINGATSFVMWVVTGSFGIPPELAGLMNTVTLGLVVITIFSVLLLVGDIKFHRFMAGAERVLRASENGGPV